MNLKLTPDQQKMYDECGGLSRIVLDIIETKRQREPTLSPHIYMTKRDSSPFSLAEALRSFFKPAALGH